MLEELTEELSGMTEQPLAKLMATKQRTAIINHTRVCHAAMSILSAMFLHTSFMLSYVL
jgi:hypothetical protein